MSKTDIRFVRTQKGIYLRKEDIVAYLLDMAAYEANDETPHDAGLRLEEAAKLLGGVGA